MVEMKVEEGVEQPEQITYHHTVTMATTHQALIRRGVGLREEAGLQEEP